MVIALVPPDRWTCPTCGRTVVPRSRTEEGLRRSIRAAQERHAARHRSRLATAAAVHAARRPNADRIG